LAVNSSILTMSSLTRPTLPRRSAPRVRIPNQAMSTTTGYSPSGAWTDLVNRCAADAATALSSLRWAAKIQYH